MMTIQKSSAAGDDMFDWKFNKAAVGTREGGKHNGELQPSIITSVSKNTWTFIHANAWNHLLYMMI